MNYLEFEKPVVSYSDGGPPFASMGASLLHRFTTVYDYERRRLILEPNARFDDAPMIDQSGIMIVMSEDGAFKPLYVAEGTPGHEAQLARGDIIRAIDGVSTRDIGLNEARTMFSRSGTYELDVERGERSFRAVMTTRPLFDD